MIHHPIVGAVAQVAQVEPVSEPANPLVIPTTCCPHCGKSRRSVVQYHKEWKDGTRPWMITWECGSSVILAGRPVLTIDRNCGNVWH